VTGPKAERKIEKEGGERVGNGGGDDGIG